MKDRVHWKKASSRSAVLLIGTLLASSPVVHGALVCEILLSPGISLPGRTGQSPLELRSITSVSVADDGTIAFVAEVEELDFAFISRGVWKLRPNGEIVRVATRGEDVLDFGFSDVLSDIDDSTLSAAGGGRVAFFSSLEGAPPTPFALFLSEQGTPAGTFVAGEGRPAQGSGDDAVFQFFTRAVGIPSGGVAFSGASRVPGGSDVGNVWTSPGGIGLESALFPEPSTPTTVFRWSPDVRILSVLPSNDVDILGRGRVDNPVVTPTSFESAWLVAKHGEAAKIEIIAPEAATGILGHVVESIFDVAVAPSRRSVVVLEALESSSSNRIQALYSGPSGDGTPFDEPLVGAIRGFLKTSGPPRFLQGTVAPGAGGLTFSSFQAVAIARDGRTAFEGRLFDPEEEGSSQEPVAIWIDRAGGGTELALRQNRPLRIGRQQSAPVSSFNLGDGNFDPQGRLVIPVRFSNDPERALLVRLRAFVPKRPRVRVDGPRRRSVKRPSLVLRGTVVADLPVDRVEFRTSSRRGIQTAKGRERWRLRTRLRGGRNRVLIHAFDIDGKRSPPVRVVIRRR